MSQSFVRNSFLALACVFSLAKPAVFVVATSLLLAGCEREGGLEEVGEEIDDEVDDATDD
jgi:hypothetical protein